MKRRRVDRTVEDNLWYAHHCKLVEELLVEIRGGDNAPAKLYAGLLLRALCEADGDLMQEYPQVEELFPEGPVRGKRPRIITHGPHKERVDKS
jgi:hypothetical protein